MVVNMIINNKDFGIGYSNSNDKSLSKNEENYFNLPWSLSKIEDELVLHLSSYYDAEIKEEIASNINSNNNNKEIFQLTTISTIIIINKISNQGR